MEVAENIVYVKASGHETFVEVFIEITIKHNDKWAVWAKVGHPKKTK